MMTLTINFTTLVFLLLVFVYYLLGKLTLQESMTMIQGVALAYIAAQQWVSQEKTRKQGLRESYLECYNDLSEAGGLVSRKGHIVPQVDTGNAPLHSPAFQHYFKALNTARLFLGENVLRHVESIYKKALDTLVLEQKTRQSPNENFINDIPIAI